MKTVYETRRREGCVDSRRVWRKTHTFVRATRCVHCGIARDAYINFLVGIAQRLHRPAAEAGSQHGGQSKAAGG